MPNSKAMAPATIPSSKPSIKDFALLYAKPIETTRARTLPISMKFPFPRSDRSTIPKTWSTKRIRNPHKATVFIDTSFINMMITDPDEFVNKKNEGSSLLSAIQKDIEIRGQKYLCP